MVTRYSYDKLIQTAYPVPLTETRVWNARRVLLPAAPNLDDMGQMTGAFGTDTSTLQGADFQSAASLVEKCGFYFALPPEYVAGGGVTLRLRAGMITTASDDTATVDVECHESDRDGAVGGDLCATGVASINALVHADKDFTITATGLAPGDLLDVRLTFGGNDNAGVTPVICEVSQIEFLLDVWR